MDGIEFALGGHELRLVGGVHEWGQMLEGQVVSHCARGVDTLGGLEQAPISPVFTRLKQGAVFVTFAFTLKVA